MGASTERVREQGVTDTEIRIGSFMPYTGNLQAFGEVGKAEAVVRQTDTILAERENEARQQIERLRQVGQTLANAMAVG